MVTGSALFERWYWQNDGTLKRAQRGEYNSQGGGGGGGGTVEKQRRDTKFGSFFSGTYTYGNVDKKPALADVGVYPDADTIRTSLPGNTPASTSFIITTPDTTFQNLNIYGDVKVRAANVTFVNCKIFGGPQNLANGSDTGVVDCNHVSCVNCRFLDCTFEPQKPDYYRNAILGHKYTAERCYAKLCTDGFGLYAHPSQAGILCDVNLIGNYVEETVYWANDPAHSDGTHNDSAQYQGGSNVLIKGNVFIASTQPSVWGAIDTRYGAPWSVSNPSIEPYDVWLITGTGSGSDKHDGGVADLIVNNQANGVGVILQDNVGKGTSNVVVDGNWFDRGLAQLSIKPGAYTITNNRFGRNSYFYTPTSQYTIRIDSRAGTTFTPALLSGGNVWEDTGDALTEGTSGGIRYNA